MLVGPNNRGPGRLKGFPFKVAFYNEGPKLFSQIAHFKRVTGYES